jgi:hypothetical protein
VGIATAIQQPGTSRTLGVVVLLALCVAAFNQMTTTVEEKVHAHNALVNGPLPTLVSEIDDDRYVLGVRSAQLTRVDPHLPTMSGRKMTEEEFVTYVTWPSDDDVTQLLDDLDVGWVFVLSTPQTEVQYHNTWIEPNHGLTVEHPLRLADSDEFCLVTDIGGHRLYRYGDCRPGDDLEGDSLGSEDPRLNPFRATAGLPLIPEPEDKQKDDSADPMTGPA